MYQTAQNGQNAQNARFAQKYSIGGLGLYFRAVDEFFDQHTASAAAASGTSYSFKIAESRGLRRLDRGKQIVFRHAETRADER